jgi:prepilin-type processing-associated H-X9-DG protein
MNNLRQSNLGLKMAVHDDSGRFRPNEEASGFWEDGAQARWWQENWGRPAKGSICPVAPDRSSTSKGTSSQQGTVNSAWVNGEAFFFAWNQTDAQLRLQNERRVGSYNLNGWISRGWWAGFGLGFSDARAFESEEHLDNPANTPVFADGVAGFAVLWDVGGALGRLWGWGARPEASDLPAANLVTGGSSLRSMGPGFREEGIAVFTIPRHGSRPSNISTAHPPVDRLPGAINASFYDGHAEQVKLERLWQLNWHKDYQPPAKRPGL